MAWKGNTVGTDIMGGRNRHRISTQTLFPKKGQCEKKVPSCVARTRNDPISVFDGETPSLKSSLFGRSPSILGQFLLCHMMCPFQESTAQLVWMLQLQSSRRYKQITVVLLDAFHSLPRSLLTSLCSGSAHTPSMVPHTASESTPSCNFRAEIKKRERGTLTGPWEELGCGLLLRTAYTIPVSCFLFLVPGSRPLFVFFCLVFHSFILVFCL